MSAIYDRVKKCYEQVSAKIDFVPEVALILGSGLGNFADRMQLVDSLSYGDIEGFPVSTVPGHAGKFLFGMIGNVKVVAMQGRVHYYEGYSMEDVVLPIRLMHMLGADKLFVTNAAGGMQDGMQPGDLMMITDQITSFIPSPLIGANEDQFGPRFPDMSEVYNRDLQNIIRETAKDYHIQLKEGTYLQFTGPQYETPAEIRMAKLLGASACGMSTACECIVANHMGMRICGISCITNLACGLGDGKLSHEEVKETANRVEEQIGNLVYHTIEKMSDI